MDRAAPALFDCFSLLNPKIEVSPEKNVGKLKNSALPISGEIKIQKKRKKGKSVLVFSGAILG